MNMSTHYDEFYKSSQLKEHFKDVQIKSWPRNRVEAIVHFCPQGRNVLDVGCGNGQLLYQLRNKFDKIVGLEYSKSRLAQAKVNLNSENFEAHEGSAEKMNYFTSNEFDCIVSADTIEHIPDVYSAASELFRITRPGGLLIINTPNIAFLKKRALLLLGRFPSTSQSNEGLGGDILFDGGHFHYFTFRSLSLLLQKYGFVIESHIGYGKFGKIHDLYPPLLSGGVQLIARKPL